ncbi:MAG: GatB/YqeY domain-containing protein [Aggregatilineales bacterium]
MENPKVNLQTALKQAIVNKDAERRDVLRMTLNAITQVEVDERRTLEPAEIAAILQAEVKKRRESIEEARAAGRVETAALEESRLAILEEFLPQQLTRDEIVALARDAIVQSGAQSAKDMGKVMSVLMPRVKGQADGKLVNEVVRELLR